MSYVALIFCLVVALLALLYGVFGKTPKHGIFFVVEVGIDKDSREFWARFDKIGVIIWRISLIVLSIGLFLITKTDPHDLSKFQIYAILAAISNTLILLVAQAALLGIVGILYLLWVVCRWLCEDVLWPSLLEPMIEKLRYVRKAIVSKINKCSEKRNKRKLDRTVRNIGKIVDKYEQ